MVNITYFTVFDLALIACCFDAIVIILTGTYQQQATAPGLDELPQLVLVCLMFMIDMYCIN
jgi:hypothetical protein